MKLFKFKVKDKGSSGIVKLSRGFGQAGYSLPDKPWLIVAWKELLESFRDKRTMINVVLLPMIIMPIVIALPMMMLSPKTVPPKIIVVVEDKGAMDLARSIRELYNESRAYVTITTSEGNYVSLILNGGADLIVEIPPGFSRNISLGRSGYIVYYYDPYGARSSVAMDMVQGIIGEYSEKILRERLAAINLSEQYIRPIATIAKQVTSTGKVATTGEVMTAMILPMMVGLIAITGAGTFAIDMIAGERERKTIEALFTSPVSRGEILLGKFGALTILSIISGVSTLLSALIGIGLAVTSLTEATAVTQPQISQFIEASNLPYITAGILITVALGGLTGNAIMVIAASFAKTFKEAQQYVGFLTFVLILPMIAIPYAPQGLYFILRVLPISSLAMFARDIIVNPGDVMPIVTSLASSVIYLVVFLWLSSKMFGRESVIYG